MMSDTNRGSQVDLEELNARFASEDAEDERSPDVPPPERDIRAYEGFADGPSAPRTIGDVPYYEFTE